MHKQGMPENENFKDLFSQGASSYARFRPTYPAGLFTWLAGQALARGLAVDLGTGNGQAAAALAIHFDRVVGVDPSAAQLENAVGHPRVTYLCATAEATGLDHGSADLVTVGQAFHWFDHARFFAEVRRLLRPGGLLAVWTYGLTTITPAVDAVVTELYSDVVGPYWEPERRLVETGYREVAFPFGELAAPPFHMMALWRLDQLTGYLGTWSALRRYVEVHGTETLNLIFAKLATAWGDAPEREVRWPLAVRAFRL